jgi:integrase
VPRGADASRRQCVEGFFERDQYEAVLSHLPEFLRPVASVAYITGWRTKSELLTRQWRHVDFANGWLRLEPGESKNGDARNFPFTPELRTVLEAQRELVRQIEKAQEVIIPWVFIHAPGTARCEAGSRIKNFRGAWAKACKAAGVPGRLVHDFRRTAVRNLERAGVSRSAAMKLTGHKTEAVYRRYAIVDSTMLQEAVDKLGALHAVEAKSPRSVQVIPVPARKLMSRSFNTALFCCTFVRTREWRNGRRAGLRIQCRKACGFKSRLSHSKQFKGF